MKNKIYYFGIACCILIMTGGIFKIQHWPGAGIIFTLSLPLLVFIFLPMAMANSFKAEENKKIRILYITAYIAFGFDLISGLFKIMHWNGASILMTIGIPLPFVLFLPAYLLYVRKDKNVNYNHLLTVLFFFAYFGATTAFLALDISKNMVDEMVINVSQEDNMNRNIREQNKIFINYLNNKQLDSIKRESIQRVNQSTDALCIYMDKLKNEMIKMSDCSNINAEQIYYRELISKDNRSVSNSIMLQEKKGNKLLKKFNAFRDLLLKESNIRDEASLNFINEVLTTEGEGIFNWNERAFGGRHMISALGYLEILKKRVLLSQTEALTAISQM